MGHPLRTKKISSFYYKTTLARLQLLLWWYYKQFMFQYYPHLYLLPLHFYAQPTTFWFCCRSAVWASRSADGTFGADFQALSVIEFTFSWSTKSDSMFLSGHLLSLRWWSAMTTLIDAILPGTRATSDSKQRNNQRTDEFACADIDDGYF